ncbi:MAG TPA: hypothetical protein PLN69_06950 [bacterium]|nr:hypothetical protein [bacterium]
MKKHIRPAKKKAFPHVPDITFWNYVLFIFFCIISILIPHLYLCEDQFKEFNRFLVTFITIASFVTIVWIYWKSSEEHQQENIIKGHEKLLHAFISRFMTHFNKRDFAKDNLTEDRIEILKTKEYAYDERIKNNFDNEIKEDLGNEIYHRLNTYKVDTEFIWGILDFIYSYQGLKKAMKLKLEEWNISDYENVLNIDIAVRKHYGMYIPNVLKKALEDINKTNM